MYKIFSVTEMDKILLDIWQLTVEYKVLNKS